MDEVLLHGLVRCQKLIDECILGCRRSLEQYYEGGGSLDFANLYYEYYSCLVNAKKHQAVILNKLEMLRVGE